MSLRFRRSVRIAPGVHVNLGFDGAGLSVGPRGLHLGVNRRGMYTSAGIPSHGNLAGSPRARLTGRASAWLPRGSLLLWWLRWQHGGVCLSA